MKELKTDVLFSQYLDIANRAIGEHKDEAPYKQMMQVGTKILGEKKIGVAIYKTDTKTPHDWFTLGMEQGKLRILEHGKENPDITWKVKEDHLRKVVGDPEEYVKHPYKLDLDWLKSRLGLS